MSEYRINTKCVQAGYEPKNGESRVVPIVQSTTFKYDSADTLGRLFDLEESGYFYTRLANPTVDTVAKKIAALESGVGAVLTSSGQAASMMFATAATMWCAPARFTAAPLICSTKPCESWESTSLSCRRRPRRSRSTPRSKRIPAVCLSRAFPIPLWWWRISAFMLSWLTATACR